MPNFKIYTKDYCHYCTKAKNLLKQRGFEYEEIELKTDDDAAWEALKAQTKMQTVPQIFFKDQLIGGFSDLAQLDAQSGLSQFRE